MFRFALVGAALLALTAAAPPTAQRQGGDAAAGFERLKALVGTWNATVDGRPSQSKWTYRLTGGGRALVEDGGGMMTVYHPDGNALLLTHYCGAGNQPRMRLKSADRTRLSFEMYDITNLASPGSYHSTHLDVVFLGDDRVELSYKGTSGGRVSTQVFSLTRDRSGGSR